MTDQTRWGIHEVQTKNKAVKYQRDLVKSAMTYVIKMDESGITDLMIEIEAEYERKYGKNVSDKMVLQIRMVLSTPLYMYGKKNKNKNKNYSRKSVFCVTLIISVGIYN